MSKGNTEELESIVSVGEDGMDEVGFRPLDVSDVCFLARYAAECAGITEDSEIRLIEERIGNRLKEPSYLGVVSLDKGRQIGYVDGIVEGLRLVLGEIYVKSKATDPGASGRDLSRKSPHRQGRKASPASHSTPSWTTYPCEGWASAWAST